MPRKTHIVLLSVVTALCMAVAVSPAGAQDANNETAQIRTGARVTNPPSGQNIRVMVRRAFAEPRSYDLNRHYGGRVTSHPIEAYLRTGERRLEHCIDSAMHPVLALAPDLDGNTVVRARIVIQGREITQIEMSDNPLSQVIERCLRAGFTQTRYHFPRSGRVIATFYLRPRPGGTATAANKP